MEVRLEKNKGKLYEKARDVLRDDCDALEH